VRAPNPLRLSGPTAAVQSLAVAQLFDWLDGHGGSATTVATVVFLLVTIVYVMLTRRLVVELRRDRAIAHTPCIAWAIDYAPPAGNTQPMAFTATNDSHTRAFHIVMCAVGQGGAWYLSTPFDLAPGTTTSALVAAPRQTAPPPVVSKVLGSEGERGRALFCQNDIGHRLRIKAQTTLPDVWSGKRRKPAWVKWYDATVAELVQL
jgi:hypothetical protein